MPSSGLCGYSHTHAHTHTDTHNKMTHFKRLFGGQVDGLVKCLSMPEDLILSPHKKARVGLKEMAQWLRSCTVLVEVLGSAPSAHIRLVTTCNSSSGVSDVSGL